LVNRRRRSANHTLRQRGSAMVEFAVVALLYFILIFGIIEFVLAVYHWSQVVKGAREGVRYAIVNDPVCDPIDLYAGIDDCTPVLNCGSAPTVTTATCGDVGVDCSNLLSQIQTGGRQDIQSANVVVTYACSGLNLPFGTPIPVVTVSIQGVVHNLVAPNLLGFNPTWAIPTVSVTKTAEDLCTAATSGPKANCD